MSCSQTKPFSIKVVKSNLKIKFMKQFLINLVIAIVVLWGVFQLLPLLALPAIFITILTVLVVVAAVVWLVRSFP